MWMRIRPLAPWWRRRLGYAFRFPGVG
jgi:hypothetical protein